MKNSPYSSGFANVSELVHLLYSQPDDQTISHPCWFWWDEHIHVLQLPVLPIPSAPRVFDGKSLSQAIFVTPPFPNMIRDITDDYWRLLNDQACKLKFRLRETSSCLCSAAAVAVCFKGRLAGLEAIESGNELSQPNF